MPYALSVVQSSLVQVEAWRHVLAVPDGNPCCSNAADEVPPHRVGTTTRHERAAPLYHHTQTPSYS